MLISVFRVLVDDLKEKNVIRIYKIILLKKKSLINIYIFNFFTNG